jgi:O-acetyl-ADP-ribose deacetylase (regulator of RNase III)
VNRALPGGGRLRVLRGDLTEQDTGAIVNAANPTLLGGGGVDGAIHRAAGPGLLAACRSLPELSPGVRCPTGEARITPGFSLAADWVIHTVGPVYARHPDPAGALGSAWASSLALARQHGLRSVAFPAISCGVYGYPAEEAAAVSLAVVARRSAELEEVRVVLFGERMFQTWAAAAAERFGGAA